MPSIGIHKVSVPTRLKSSIKIECGTAGDAVAHRDSVPGLESEPTSAREPDGNHDSDGGDA